MGKSRILIYAIAVLSCLVSVIWFLSQFDYEPLLALLSCIGAITALLTADEFKDYNALNHWVSQQPEFAALSGRFKHRLEGGVNALTIHRQNPRILRRYHRLAWLISLVLAGFFVFQVAHIPFGIWMKWKARRVFLENFWAARFSQCNEEAWITQLDFDDLKGFLAIKANPETFEIKQAQLTECDYKRGYIWAAHVYIVPSASRIYRKKLSQNDQAEQNDAWSDYTDGLGAAKVFGLQGVNAEVVMIATYNKESGWAVRVPDDWYSERAHNIIQTVIVDGIKAPKCADVP